MTPRAKVKSQQIGVLKYRASKLKKRAFSFWELFLVMLLLALLMTPVHAARRTLAISETVYKEMQKSQLLVEEKKYGEAREVLDKLLGRKLNPYEIAQIHSIFGSIYYQQEDYENAYLSFQKVVADKAIPEGLYQLTLKTLSQLALVTDRNQAAQAYLNELLSLVKTPDAQLYVLLAQAHLSVDEYRKALLPLTKAISMEREDGKTIRENWLLMLNSIFYSLEMYPDMLKVLQELVVLYPKTQYWVNLAAIYGQMEDTKEQLLILEPLYEQGRIDRETLLLNLANLYLLHGVPVKSAELLSKAITEGTIKASRKNYEMLAQSWQLSQELDQAIHPLQTASELAKDGKTNLRLAQIYFYLYDWRNAEAELEKALQKGRLDQPGSAGLMLGMAQYNQKKYDDALESLRTAAEFDGAASLAKQWMAFVSSEKSKQEQIK